MRNRDKILAAARALFAEAEGEVSMAEISRRADVGMATLYRNFPDRRELLETLFRDDVEAICEAARETGETPGAALMTWLQGFFFFATTKHHVVPELLAYSDRGNPIFGESRARVLAAGRPLLAAAQESGEVRDDLTLEQVLDMILGIATIHGDTLYLEPILQATLDGLRPPRDRDPP